MKNRTWDTLVLCCVWICISASVSTANAQKCMEILATGSHQGRYILSRENRCDERDAWWQEYGTNHLHYSSEEGAWLIADIPCGEIAAIRSASDAESPIQGGLEWEILDNEGDWTSSDIAASCVRWSAGTQTASTCKLTHAGQNYTGDLSQTYSGRTCQRWDSQVPQSHTCDSGFPGGSDVIASDAENFCRNPSSSDCGAEGEPWCYTTDPAMRWEYCDIPKCGQLEDQTCASPLGMDNGDIEDRQMSASSTYNGDAQPWRARFGNKLPGHKGAWFPTYSDRNTCYWVLDLKTYHRISKMYMQGGGNAVNGFTRTFAIYTSPDGFHWMPVVDHLGDIEPQIFTGNSDRYGTIDHFFNPPIEGALISIIPKSYYNYPALRLEFFGCSTGDNTKVYTNLSSDITTDTYWELSRSPYLIEKNIYVRYPAKLTVQAGVRVYFTNINAKLTVQGCLYSSGLEGLEVVFSTSSPSSVVYSTHSLWSGIQFDQNACGNMSHTKIIGASTAIQLSTTGVKLDYVTIRNAQTGIRAAYTGVFEISSSHIRMAKKAVWIGKEVTTIQLLSSTFIGDGTSSSYGLELEGNNVGGGEFVVDGCSFDNFYYGVQTSNWHHPRYRILNTIFKNCFYGLHSYVYYNAKQENFTMDSCSFENCKTYAVSIDHRSYVKTSISNCVIKDSARSIYINGQNSENNDILISRVTLHDNNEGLFVYNTRSLIQLTESSIFRNKQYAIKLQYARMDIIIRDNNITDHTGEHLVYIDRSDTYGQTPTISVTGNRFVNNSGLSTLFYKDIGHLPVNINENIFQNSEAEYDVRLGISWKEGYTVDVTRNFWGSSDPSHIIFRVYDLFQDIDIAEAVISPAYHSRELTSEIVVGRALQWIDGGFGGYINEDGNLPIGIDDIMITLSIVIPAGVQFSVDRDIVITFRENTGILIQGSLEMNGDSISGIMMRPSSDYWGGIRSSNAYNTKLINCHIRNARSGMIMYQSSAILGSIVVEQSENDGLHFTGDPLRSQFLHISNATLRDSGKKAISIVDTTQHHWDIDISNVTFTGNRDVSVFINVQNSTIGISDCHFEMNRYDDVSLLSSEGATVITKTTFLQKMSNYYNIRASLSKVQYAEKYQLLEISHNTFDVQDRYGYGVYVSGERAWHESEVKVISNTYMHKSYHGLMIEMSYQYYPSCSKVLVEGNIFGSYQTRNAAVYMRCYKPQFVRVQNNTFKGVQSSQNILYVYINHGSTNDGFRIENNKFHENIGTNEIVSITRSGSDLATTLVNENTFINNTAEVVVRSQMSNTYVTGNHFDNPGSTYDLAAGTPVGSSGCDVLYATNNWWGSTDVTQISQRIHDQADDLSKANVIYEPYLLDPVTKERTAMVQSFFRANNEIGGSVESDTTIKAENSPYTAVEDIIVHPLVTLTIEAGTTIFFKHGGILVHGQLNIEGRSDERVTLTPAEGAVNWKGITFDQSYPELLRLVNGPSENEGIVEFWHNGGWFSMCGQSFEQTIQTADIVCQQLGYSGASKYYFTDSYTNVQEERTTTMPTSTVYYYEEYPISEENDEEFPSRKRRDYSQALDMVEDHASTRQKRQNDDSVHQPKLAKYVSCGTVSTLIHKCNIYACTYSGYNRQYAAVSCADDADKQQLGQPTQIESHLTGTGSYLSLTDEYKPVFAQDFSKFQLLQPGLTKKPGTVSVMSTDKPDWYMRHDGSSVQFEPKCNPTNKEQFNEQATFLLTEDSFLDGYFTLEAVGALKGHFLVSFPNEPLRMVVIANNSFHSPASFRLISDIQHVKKRALEDVDVNIRQSSVQYTVVNHTQQGVRVKNKPPILDHLEVKHCWSHCLHYSGILLDDWNVTNSQFKHSQGRGVYIDMTENTGVIVRLENNTIEHTQKEGAYLHGDPDWIITRNKFLFSNTRAIHMSLSDSSASVTDNIIAHNTNGGVHQLGQGNMEFVGNHLENNTHGLVLASHTSYYRGSDVLIVENNTFVNNTHTYTYYWYAGILLEIYSGHSIVKLNNNRLEGNTVSTALISIAAESQTNIADVMRNYVVGNKAGDEDVTMLKLVGPTEFMKIQHNVFWNPEAKYEMTVPNFDDNGVQASHGYWGVNDTNGILSRISCFYNDITLSLVEIWPYQVYIPSEETTVYQSGPSDEDFFLPENRIGGDAVNNINVEFSSMEHIVQRSIYVRPNATLSIASGVKIRFFRKVGILVRGKLKLEGPVHLSSNQVGGKWHGIRFDAMAEGSVIDHLNISDVSSGISSYISSMSIDNLNISDSTYGIIHYGAGNLTVTGSTLTNVQYPFTVERSVGQITVRNNTFNSCSRPVWIKTGHSLEISGCNIMGSGESRIYVEVGGSQINARIEDNTFSTCKTPLHLSFGQDSRIEISGNTFYQSFGNTYEYESYIYSRGRAQIFFEKNKFVDSDVENIYVTSSSSAGPEVFINENTFSGTKYTCLVLTNPGYIKYEIKKKKVPTATLR